MPEFIPQYYRMNPETEEAMFGRDLMNGMVVLIEAPARRADLDARSIEVATLRPATEVLSDHIMHQALRFNRWAKVTRLQTIEEEKVRQVLFIAEYEDGLRSTMTSYMTTGWLVKEDSIPEDWQPAGEQKVPNFVKWNGEGIAKKYCELKGLKMVPIDEGFKIEGSNEATRESIRNAMRKKLDELKNPGIAKWMEQQESLSELQVAMGLLSAGYGTMAISQIMQVSPDRVTEILDGDVDEQKPFLWETTQRKMLDDLESGRLRLEVPPFQDGREVTATIKPGPNYRPVDPEFEAQKKRLQLESSRRVLAHRMTGDGKTVEEISKFLDIHVGLVKLLLSSEPTESEMDSNHMLNLGASGKFPPCTCTEHGPCPTHAYLTD